MYRLFMKLNLTRPVPAIAKSATAPLLWGSVLAALFLGLIVEQPVHASSRIKDIIDFEGVRDNMLVGYGIVVGLNGTGDDLTNSPFTSQSLVGMLERMGINTRGVTLKTKMWQLSSSRRRFHLLPGREPVSTYPGRHSVTRKVYLAEPC